MNETRVNLNERTKPEYEILASSFVFSYPRSGNTLLRRILENLTRVPSVGYYNSSDIDLPLHKDRSFYRSKYYPILKRHPLLPAKIFLANVSGANLLVPAFFLVRDFKSAIPRQQSASKNKKNFFDIVQNDVKGYVLTLNLYQRWAGEKILIYYEDLLSDPEREVDKIKDFINVKTNYPHIDDAYFSHFMSDYEEQRKISLKFYDEHEKSKTKGNLKSKANVGLLSEEQRNRLDRMITENHPNILQYVERYLG